MYLSTADARKLQDAKEHQIIEHDRELRVGERKSPQTQVRRCVTAQSEDLHTDRQTERQT
jgi:hypothetical protein